MNFRVLLLAIFPLIWSCSSSCKCADSVDLTLDPDVPPLANGSWWKPQQQVEWQWQLQGTLDTSVQAEIFDVDMEYTSREMIVALQQSGRKVICYFSAGSWENFRDDIQTISPNSLGDELDGWPEERWWNIMSEDVQQLILQRLDTAHAKGCNAVEPDNVDAYQNENGLGIDYNAQLAFNRWLANAAHERGLAVGLKNDLGQIPELVAYFDFAVNEQCHEYEECDTYEPFLSAGKPVLNAEYLSKWVTNSTLRKELCQNAHSEKIMTLVLPLDLDGSYRYSCKE